LLASVALLAPLASLAQDNGRRQIGPWIWGIEGGAIHQFDTELSNEQGSFSVNRYFIQPSVAYAWDRRNTVSLAVGFGEADYDFSAGTKINAQQPWSRIREARISLPIRFSPSARSDAIVIPIVRSYAEKGASLDDGRTQGLLAGIGWKLSDTLFIGPGFGWYSELGDSSKAFPILVIDWSITEKLTLTTGRGLGASQGPGLDLTYSLNENWKVGLTGRYEEIRFALDTDPVSPRTYGEDRGLPLFLSVRYSPWPMTMVGAFLGADFGGKLSILDRNGQRLSTSEYDVAPSVGLVFRSRF
jgi:hypothetical protein